MSSPARQPWLSRSAVRGHAAVLAAILASAGLGASACGPGGTAPQVEPIDTQVVAVNEELVVRIDATDEDGDALTYSYDTSVPDIRSRASLTQLPIGAGEFRWTPKASDVGEWFFDFHVSDGDYTTTITVQVDVRSAVGASSAPRFVKPVSNGTTLDLGMSRCLDLDVEVDDVDSLDVDLSLTDPALDGAELTVTGDRTASVHWCPTTEQVAGGNRYTLSLAADDGDNPPTVLHYLVVLRQPPKSCPGEAPVVVHTPSDASTLQNLTIEATITDDVGLKDAPLVFYSEVEPASPPDVGTMSLAVMAKSGADTWAATLPNPVAADPPGTQRTLYYVILARDDDDPTGSCDHEVVAPDGSAYSTTVTNPGGTGGMGLCESCVADAQCGGGDADLCVRIGGEGGAYCLTGCTSDDDCELGYSCSDSAVTSVEGTAARQCVPDVQTCEIQCQDDSFEDNDNRQQAALGAPLAVGVYDAVSCPVGASDDDEDWYRIVLEEDAAVDLEIDGDDASDLDLYLYDGEGAFVVGSGGFDSSEALSSCLSAGTYYARVVAYGHAENDYTLLYDAQPMTCATSVCTPDELEDNDVSGEATVVLLDESGAYEKNGLGICPGDEDWFQVALFDGETLSVLLDFTNADGDIDVAILGPDASTVEAAGVSNDDGELISYTRSPGDDGIPTCGPDDPSCVYYVEVVGQPGEANAYDLLLEVSQ